MNIFKTVIIFQEPHQRTDLPRGELLSILELLYEEMKYEVIEINSINVNNNVPRWLINDSKTNIHADKDHFDYELEYLLKDENSNMALIYFLEQCTVIHSNFLIDNLEVIKRAAYIQSIGEEIFLTEWDSLSVDYITNKFIEFGKNKKKYYPINFYTKSENDTHNEKLELILIDDKRFHIGDLSFKVAKEKIIKEYDNALQNLNIINSGDGNIFVLKDSVKKRLVGSLVNLYQERNVFEFAIGYLSLFKKDNPIHLLDNLNEAKPFWAGIFTTPHRLINSMLNLAKLNKGSSVVDPFCHTGTVAIEAAQLGCNITCADISEPLGAEDNFKFLCSGSEHFRKVKTELSDICNDFQAHRAYYDLASDSATINSHGMPEVSNDMQIEKLLQKNNFELIDLNTLSNRLFFYIVRRYELQRIRGFDSEYQEGVEKVKEFLALNVDEKLPPKGGYDLCSRQFIEFERAFNSTGNPILKKSDLEFKDIFCDSHYLTPRIGIHHLTNEFNAKFIKADITKGIDQYGINKSSIDAVVTDPPYGYGEGLAKEEIKDLYINLFEKSFYWLKSDGFLVFCALDKVKTGRTKGLLFTEDIIMLANKIARKNKIKFLSRNIYPLSQNIPIYYWKSKYALNRSIIVFNIFKDK